MKKFNNNGLSKVEQVFPYIAAMDALFKDMLQMFQDQPFVTRNELPSYAGIYVFYRDGLPIYVGRADNIRRRIQGHTRASSGSESANFAFNLAKLELFEKVSESKLGRKQLMTMPGFRDIFSKHKADLHASQLRCVQIENDIIQTMFEPYLAIKLGTYPHNNIFDNH
jgi:hypothetical protein